MMYRYRLTYSKKGALKYTGMLDLQKMWERIFRRAKLPVAYSQGFHPLPKFHMAAPLPLGFDGDQELADIWLTVEKDQVDIRDALNRISPEGMIVNHVESIDLSTPVLQTVVDFAEYTVTSMLNLDDSVISAEIDSLLRQSRIDRVRRNKTYDLRPLILELKYDHSKKRISMRLLAREGASGRPDEVMDALGFDPLSFQYTRTKISLLN